jgi:hypothetical protein
VRSHYNIKVTLFFTIIPEHIYAFVTSWQKYKNSVAVEIEFLHLQLFMNSHFHCLLHYYGIGDLPNVASEAQTNGSLTGQGQDYRSLASD